MKGKDRESGFTKFNGPQPIVQSVGLGSKNKREKNKKNIGEDCEGEHVCEQHRLQILAGPPNDRREWEARGRLDLVLQLAGPVALSGDTRGQRDNWHVLQHQSV